MSASRRPRVVLVCPGRGSYTRDLLGSLGASHDPASRVIRAADTSRRVLGRPTPSEMDSASTYSSRLHVAGENASILTATCSLADHAAIVEAGQVEVVGVIGNSMGWYTALTVAGALPLADGLRLIETMGQYQADNVIGGQLVYPLCGPGWETLPSPELDATLREVPDLYVSIRLGRQVVLGGTDTAIRLALSRLPTRKAGDRDAPFQLPLHSAFHTPLMQQTSSRAMRDLADLAFAAPSVPLVDGRGSTWFPRHADPIALAHYTLGPQVVAPYDFGLSVRVALRELAPDAMVLLGPGGNLGGAVGQALLDERWAGMRTRADFSARQAGSGSAGLAPFVWSLTRPDQRRLALGAGDEPRSHTAPS